MERLVEHIGGPSVVLSKKNQGGRMGEAVEAEGDMSTAPLRGWRALSAWGRGTRAGMEQRSVKVAWRWHNQEVERVVKTCIVLSAAAAGHGWSFGPVHHDRVTPLVVLVD